MSFKVEIDSADAELLAMLKRQNVSFVQNWDITIKEGVTLKITLNYAPTDNLPQLAVSAINKCITDIIASFPRKAPESEPGT